MAHRQNSRTSALSLEVCDLRCKLLSPHPLLAGSIPLLELGVTGLGEGINLLLGGSEAIISSVSRRLSHLHDSHVRSRVSKAARKS